MKKLMLGLTLCLILVSCTSKEERGAIEFLKNNIKTPSSFKMISCEATVEDEIFVYDTVYHIVAIEGEKLLSCDDYISTTSVNYDSLRIYRRPLIAHTKYHIVYEAANEYGTMIRNETNVYYYNGIYTDNVKQLMGEIESPEDINTEGTIPYNRPFGCNIKIGQWYGFYTVNGSWQSYEEKQLF